MEIIKTAKAGSLFSNDVLIMISPNDELVIELDTIVKQFEEAILDTIQNKLAEMNVAKGLIQIKDKGALDYTLRARLETAILRGIEL